jgi:hypothetical protein
MITLFEKYIFEDSSAIRYKYDEVDPLKINTQTNIISDDYFRDIPVEKKPKHKRIFKRKIKKYPLEKPMKTKFKDFIQEDYRNVTGQGTMGFNNPTGLGNVPHGDASYKNASAVPDYNQKPMIIGAEEQGGIKDPYFLNKDPQPKSTDISKNKKKYKDRKFKRMYKRKKLLK